MRPPPLLLLCCSVLAVVQATPFSEALEANAHLATHGLKDLPQGQEPTAEEMRDMYLSLMSNSVLGLSLPNSEYSFVEETSNTERRDNELLVSHKLDEEMRRNGTDLPFIGISASGERNLQRIRKVLENKYNELKSGEVDVVSCAQFRGGTAVFMRAVLNSMGIYHHTACVVILGSMELPEEASLSMDESDMHLSNSDRVLQESPFKRSLPPESTSLTEYMTLQSSSRIEVVKNIAAHFPVVPGEEMRIIDIDSCQEGGTTDASCVTRGGGGGKKKIALLHIGPAGVEEVAQCMSVVRPHLAEGAVVIADRCFYDRGCSKALAGENFEEDSVVMLESGGVMGVNGKSSMSGASTSSFGIADVSQPYLLLLKASLVGNALSTSEFCYDWFSNNTAPVHPRHDYHPIKRYQGDDWPWIAVTMIGYSRMNQLQQALEYVVDRGIAGDFAECGTWRGGASIFARGVWDMLGQQHRRVWVADSFSGLPPNRTTLDALGWSLVDFLRVSTTEVHNNFRAHNLANEDNVIFLKGYFVDTLPSAPIKQLSILRLDGDMFESTLDSLINLYGRLSIGGMVIVDDAPRIAEAQHAIMFFREMHNISSPITVVYDSFMGCHWTKNHHVDIRRDLYIDILKDPQQIEYQRQLMSKEQSCAASGQDINCWDTAGFGQIV